LHKWLNRHSQRTSYNWSGFNELLKHFNILRPRIVKRPKLRLVGVLV
jgi:RNA-directed DNA polymerase